MYVRNPDLAAKGLVVSRISLVGHSRHLPRNTQLPPHGDPGCGFLVPLDLEGAQRQREGRRGPLHEMR